jgi:hypothetical protein
MITATPLSRISSQMVVSTFQLAAGLQAEGDVVLDRAGDPAVLGDPGDRREAHAGRAADHVQDFRMKTRAAVAFEAKKPLEIVEVDLEGPKAGEVLVEIKATGICHTDAYTLDGFDSEGIFPSILGHEGAGVVVEVGAGRHLVKPSATT